MVHIFAQFTIGACCVEAEGNGCFAIIAAVSGTDSRFIQ